MGGGGRADGRRGDAGRSISTILVVGLARCRMNLKICRSDAILARSVGPWRCSMRACAFRIAALPSGMRVVCVRGRGEITSAPPNDRDPSTE